MILLSFGAHNAISSFLRIPLCNVPSDIIILWSSFVLKNPSDTTCYPSTDTLILLVWNLVSYLLLFCYYEIQLVIFCM